LNAQFEKLDEINEKRKFAFDYYYNNLKIYEDNGIIRLPYIPKECEINYHMFYIILNTSQERDRVMKELKKRGILALFHYIPLHTSEMGKKLGNNEGDLPMTEEYAHRLLRLPMYADLNEKELSYIVKNLKEILMNNECLEEVAVSKI